MQTGYSTCPICIVFPHDLMAMGSPYQTCWRRVRFPFSLWSLLRHKSTLSSNYLITTLTTDMSSANFGHLTTFYEPNQISVIGVNETTLMQLTRLSDRGIHSSSSEIEEGISSVEARRPQTRCSPARDARCDPSLARRASRIRNKSPPRPVAVARRPPSPSSRPSDPKTGSCIH